MNHTDTALWETILWATTDNYGDPLDSSFSTQDVDPDSAAELNSQYFFWRDQTDDMMITYGFGDRCLEDLLGDRVPHLYVLVRDGHGASMTDRWEAGSDEWKVCRDVEHLARLQGPIGAMVDGGVLILSWPI